MGVKPKRRMGPQNSTTRDALMDAVEAVMREDGYAAVSARSVAARAGLKYQLVFYYFETMDELVLATYRRSCQAMWLRVVESMSADLPLHAFWSMWADPFDAAVSLEFMAMANHNDAIREEKKAFSERVRKLVAEKFSGRQQYLVPHSGITPFSVSMGISCIGGILAFEQALGIMGGHEETRAMVQWCLDQVEPRRVSGGASAPKRRAGSSRPKVQKSKRAPA